MSMSWIFLVVIFMALCAFAVVIGVMVMLFRAASKSSQRPSHGASGVPPILGDDSLTNPANPLYHLHHPTATPDGASHASSDSAPSSSPSFDSGSSAGASFDSGSSSSSSDSGGSGCG